MPSPVTLAAEFVPEATTIPIGEFSHLTIISEYLQCAPVPLHFLSHTGRILWANDAELRYTGYSAEEYVGHEIIEVTWTLSDGLCLSGFFTISNLFYLLSLSVSFIFDFLQFLCPSEREKLQETMAKLISGQTVLDVSFEFRSKNGEGRHFLINSNAVFGCGGESPHIRYPFEDILFLAFT